MKILAVANQKGGVGKTTVAVHLAAGLSIAGHRVLLVDADHQASATQNLGVDSDPNRTLGVWLPGGQGDPMVVETRLRGLDVLPANVNLADDEWAAIRDGVDPQLIADHLRGARFANSYDWMIIDMPPSLAFWARVGFVTAHRVLVPLVPASFSISGFRQLSTRIDEVRFKRWNPSLRLLGVVLNLVDRRTTLGRYAADLLEGIVDPALLFREAISYSASVGNAQLQNLVVFEAYDRSAVAMQFAHVVEEVLERWPDNLRVAQVPS